MQAAAPQLLQNILALPLGLVLQQQGLPLQPLPGKAALPGGSLLHLGCIAADKAAHRAVSTAVAVAGGAHDRPEAVHLGLAFCAGQAAFGQIALKDDLIQRLAALLAEVDHLMHG